MFSDGFMFGEFFSIIWSQCVDLCFQKVQQVDDGLFHLLSIICLAARQSGIAEICFLPEWRRHHSDDCRWWYRFPSHQCVNASPPLSVVGQSKPGWESFHGDSDFRNFFYVSSLSANECGDHLLQFCPSRYTGRSIHGWPWFFLFSKATCWSVPDSNPHGSKTQYPSNSQS